MTTREKLHRLVDHLPESEVPAAERYLEYLSVARQDPVFQALMNAPVNDEPETEGGRAAVPEARAALRRGEVISERSGISRSVIRRSGQWPLIGLNSISAMLSQLPSFDV